ncbi:MAG: Fic family protein [Nanoarchaeota archaeon]|nr:Fic family protein [Nanoarchaeota archaeon]
MFIETRKLGKKKKYYLVHSYRKKDKVNRISRYLGSDLSKKELEKLRKRAELLILEQLKDTFEHELSKDEINEYWKFESKIDLEHLQRGINWLRFTEEFTYNTNAIEGSAVEFSEVRKLIEKKDSPQNHEETETLGVAEAIEYVKNTKDKLYLKLIKKLHFLCFKDSKHFAGEFRNVEVVITDGHGQIVHRGAPAKEVEKLLKNLVRQYNKHEKKYPPLLLAALTHNHFENIHPFQDGNGRVGRLLINYVLLKHNYPPLNIRLKDRMQYYNVLQEFERTGNINPTLRFLKSQYKK